MERQSLSPSTAISRTMGLGRSRRSRTDASARAPAVLCAMSKIHVCPSKYSNCARPGQRTPAIPSNRFVLVGRNLDGSSSRRAIERAPLMAWCTPTSGVRIRSTPHVAVEMVKAVWSSSISRSRDSRSGRTLRKGAPTRTQVLFNMSRISSSLSVVINGTPPLMIPAFSRAISGSVSPRYSVRRLGSSRVVSH